MLHKLHAIHFDNKTYTTRNSIQVEYVGYITIQGEINGKVVSFTQCQPIVKLNLIYPIEQNKHNTRVEQIAIYLEGFMLCMYVCVRVRGNKRGGNKYVAISNCVNLHTC